MKTKILIFGGRGYIGSALSTLLSNLKFDVTISDNSNHDWFPFNTTLITGDICSENFLKKIVKDQDYIINLSGIEKKDAELNIQEDLEVNGSSIYYLCKTIIENNPKAKLIQFSSANLYETGELNENTKDEPLSVWSIHKLLAENYINYFSKTFGLNALILRLSNVYGPTIRKDVNDRVAVNKMIQWALGQKPFILYENFNCIRDFIYLEDLTDLIIKIIDEQLVRGIKRYNVMSGEPITYWQIARKIDLFLNKFNNFTINTNIKLTPFETRELIVTDKSVKINNYIMSTKINTGLKQTIEYFQNRT